MGTGATPIKNEGKKKTRVTRRWGGEEHRGTEEESPTHFQPTTDFSYLAKFPVCLSPIPSLGIGPLLLRRLSTCCQYSATTRPAQLRVCLSSTRRVFSTHRLMLTARLSHRPQTAPILRRPNLFFAAKFPHLGEFA